MSGRAATWITATAGVAVVAGAVVFLSLQTLEDADSWSSVGAFLAALVTVVVSAVGWVSTRGAPGPEGTGRSRRRWWVLNIGNENVFTGDGNHNRVVHGDVEAVDAVDGVGRRERQPAPAATQRPRARRPARK